ncbi:MAG: tetratricopeptide repeat protein [Chitinophagaceae bacterium]|nr:tetratricopeptide repeat protein [Anaerolineae bacterium]
MLIVVTATSSLVAQDSTALPELYPCTTLDEFGRVAEDYAILLQLARTSLNLNDYDNAAGQYACAILLEPDQPLPYSGRGVAYLNLDELDLALADFNTAVRVDPLYYRAYANRGLTYYSLGRFDEALRDYSRALAIEPNYARAYNNRGLVRYASGQHDFALTDFTRAIGLGHTPLAWPYFNRGRTYAQLGQLQTAAADFEAAIVADRNYSPAYYWLADMYYQLDRPEDSQDVLRRVESLLSSPSDAIFPTPPTLRRKILIRAIPLLAMGGILFYAVAYAAWGLTRQLVQFVKVRR